MEYWLPGEGNMEELKFPTGQMDMKEEGRNLWQGKIWNIFVMATIWIRQRIVVSNGLPAEWDGEVWGF